MQLVLIGEQKGKIKGKVTQPQQDITGMNSKTKSPVFAWLSSQWVCSGPSHLSKTSKILSGTTLLMVLKRHCYHSEMLTAVQVTEHISAESG